MGCDVHTVVEVWDPSTTGWLLVVPRPPGIRRDYRLFAALARVRPPLVWDEHHKDVQPVCEPRGWPEDMSMETLKRFGLPVNSGPQLDMDLEGHLVSLADAELWVHLHRSVCIRRGSTLHVTSPDLHSASWLLLSELQAYDWVGNDCLSSDMKNVIRHMAQVPGHTRGIRLVVAFVN